MSKYGKIILKIIFITIIGGLLALLGRALYRLWKGIRGAQRLLYLFIRENYIILYRKLTIIKEDLNMSKIYTLIMMSIMAVVLVTVGIGYAVYDIRFLWLAGIGVFGMVECTRIFNSLLPKTIESEDEEDY